jgi:hypothetical protein
VTEVERRGTSGAREMFLFPTDLVDFLQLKVIRSLIVRIQIERTLIHPSVQHASELSPGPSVTSTEAPSVAAAVESYFLGTSVELLDEVQYPTAESAVAAVRQTDSVFMLRFTAETEAVDLNDTFTGSRQRSRARRATPAPAGDGKRSSVA